MARVIPPAMRSAILSGAIWPVLLAYVDWPGGAVRVHTGVGTLAWDGHDWTGIGHLGLVNLPQAAVGMGQEAGTLTLGGLPEVIDAMLGEDSAGAQVEVWFGCLTGRTPAPLVSDPVRVFSGYVDDAGDNLDVAGGTHQGWLSIISGPSQMSTGSPVHTMEDQQAIDPTDTAGRWVRAAWSAAVAQVPQW